MKLVAALTMVLAWLLYGIMPVMADAPVLSPAAMHASMDHGQDMHHQAPHDHAAVMAGAVAKDRGNPCPHGDGMAHSPFCAACLVIPPIVAIDGGGPFAFSYPSPFAGDPLQDTAPAPLAPPPRA